MTNNVRVLAVLRGESYEPYANLFNTFKSNNEYIESLKEQLEEQPNDKDLLEELAAEEHVHMGMMLAINAMGLVIGIHHIYQFKEVDYDSERNKVKAALLQWALMGLDECKGEKTLFDHPVGWISKKNIYEYLKIKLRDKIYVMGWDKDSYYNKLNLNELVQEASEQIYESAMEVFYGKN